MYLGPKMNIECLLRHFLSKNNLTFVHKDNIHSMCITIGIRYDYWILIYNNYINKFSLTFDVNFINVLDVFLYKHSIK